MLVCCPDVTMKFFDKELMGSSGCSHGTLRDQDPMCAQGGCPFTMAKCHCTDKLPQHRRDQNLGRLS